MEIYDGSHPERTRRIEEFLILPTIKLLFEGNKKSFLSAITIVLHIYNNDVNYSDQT